MVAAARLLAQIRDQIGGTGRDAHDEIERVVVTFDKRIEHAAGKDAAHRAPFDNQGARVGIKHNKAPSAVIPAGIDPGPVMDAFMQNIKTPQQDDSSHSRKPEAVQGQT